MSHMLLNRAEIVRIDLERAKTIADSSVDAHLELAGDAIELKLGDGGYSNVYMKRYRGQVTFGLCSLLVNHYFRMWSQKYRNCSSIALPTSTNDGCLSLFYCETSTISTWYPLWATTRCSMRTDLAGCVSVHRVINL